MYFKSNIKNYNTIQVNVTEISGVPSGKKKIISSKYLSMSISVTNIGDHRLTSIGFYF